MERIDFKPTIEWAPEDLMSEVEGIAMFAQLGLGELVVTDTAWHARRVLTHWPAGHVEHPIPPDARIAAYLDDVATDPVAEDVARQVLNRSLASADRVEGYPDLADLDAERSLKVWLALVFRFAIKSGLHNRTDGDR